MSSEPVSVAETTEGATSEPNHTFRVFIKCSKGCHTQLLDGLSKKDVDNMLKKHATRNDEHKNERKCCDRIHAPTHKPEPYVAPEVSKLVCRDTFCKAHYVRPIIRPSSSKNMPPIPPSPLCPPPSMPFYGPPRPMYPPSPLLTQNNGLTPYGYPAYGNRW